VSIDLGTGDGRLPYRLAREAPERLFVGIDANAAGLIRFSGRAVRAGLPNVLYVRAAVERLPSALAGVADRVSVVLPWGSLLAAVAGRSAAVLQGVRALCQSGARLTVVLGLDPARDRAEILRLGLPPLTDARFGDDLGVGYAAAGFSLISVRPMGRDQLARLPSTWARRLAHGGDRSLLRIEARAAG
jgi:16S rRNA (adenine(1408)-N(1))-methyltransferase